MIAATSSTFEIAERHGVWRVTLDGLFFGDYRSKALADAGAEDAAAMLRAKGRSVQVVERSVAAGVDPIGAKSWLSSRMGK